MSQVDPRTQLPRTTRVKNKQPADKQITAEQLLREAKDIKLEDDYKAPKQIITDAEELGEYRLAKRKEFEDLVRRVGRFNGAVWVKVRSFPARSSRRQPPSLSPAPFPFSSCNPALPTP